MPCYRLDLAGLRAATEGARGATSPDQLAQAVAELGEQVERAINDLRVQLSDPPAGAGGLARREGGGGPADGGRGAARPWDAGQQPPVGNAGGGLARGGKVRRRDPEGRGAEVGIGGGGYMKGCTWIGKSEGTYFHGGPDYEGKHTQVTVDEVSPSKPLVYDVRGHMIPQSYHTWQEGQDYTETTEPYVPPGDPLGFSTDYRYAL